VGADLRPVQGPGSEQQISGTVVTSKIGLGSPVRMHREQRAW
jgi:hypothetical protein